MPDSDSEIVRTSNKRKSTAEPVDNQPKRTKDTAVPLEVIVEDGDLVVTVVQGDEEQIRYQVPAQLLWTASKAFRASIGPRSNYDAAVQLRKTGCGKIVVDDDADDMGLVLRLICYQFETLPKEISFQTLHGIALIADKYGMEGALARGWVSEWSKALLIKAADLTLDQWLFVAWVFRYDDMFQAITRKITLSAATTLGQIVGVPEVVIGRLTQLRIQRVNKMRTHLANVRAARAGLKPDTWPCKKNCPNAEADHTRACHFLQQGFLEHTIAYYGFDKSSTWEKPLEHFKKELFLTREVCIQYYKHSGCGWLEEFKRVIVSALEEDLHLKLSEFPSRA